MKIQNRFRRKLLKSGLGIAVAPWMLDKASAQSGIRIRQEWQQFKLTSQYPSFLNAIASMRANTNPASRGSLQFWTQVHVNHCPHGAPYFISWHRGYLYYFEQQLRIASGDPELNLPYWDYYSYTTLPAEFTDPSATNPLYMPRMSANVYQALSLLPFAPTVHNFQHGTSNAFEPKIEDVHNPVHDLIGGVMTTMQSPLDPIFFLHHGSVDRLTHAWALPDGKGIPLSAFPYSSTNSDPYWAGNNVYASDLSIERYRTLDPNWLGNDYADTSVPITLPPVPSALKTQASKLAPSAVLPARQRPPFRSLPTVRRRRISESRRSLGGFAQLAFDEQSVSVRLRLDKTDAAEVGRVVAARRGGSETGTGARIGTIKVVIDGASVGALAARGGYFYALYLNMPAASATSANGQSFIGTLGAFQIAAASHHGPARLEFDVSDLLAQQKISDFSALTLSWIRIDGDQAPAGKTIRAEELRVELAFDAPSVNRAALVKPANWYGRRE